jgi:hypothetical protein
MNDVMETLFEFAGRMGVVETTPVPRPDAELERLRAALPVKVEGLEVLMRADVRD